MWVIGKTVLGMALDRLSGLMERSTQVNRKEQGEDIKGHRREGQQTIERERERKERGRAKREPKKERERARERERERGGRKKESEQPKKVSHMLCVTQFTYFRRVENGENIWRGIFCVAQRRQV